MRGLEISYKRCLLSFMGPYMPNYSSSGCLLYKKNSVAVLAIVRRSLPSFGLSVFFVRFTYSRESTTDHMKEIREPVWSSLRILVFTHSLFTLFGHGNRSLMGCFRKQRTGGGSSFNERWKLHISPAGSIIGCCFVSHFYERLVWFLYFMFLSNSCFWLCDFQLHLILYVQLISTYYQ